MKKFTIIAGMAAAVVAISSCDGIGGSASLKNDVDTLSYCLGSATGEGIQQQMMYGGLDTTYVAEFIKGIEDGVKSEDDKKKAAYYAGIKLGMQIGSGVKNFNRQIFGEDTLSTLSMKNILAGIKDAANHKAIIAGEEAVAMIQAKQQAIQEATNEKLYGENKAAGEKFMAEKAADKSLKALANGVYAKVIAEGTGACPSDTSIVKVHYEGKTIDGEKFDSSYDREQPMTVNMRGGMIPGFMEAVKNMPLGSKWEVYIPQEQAYGGQSNPRIKPFSALVFTIEIVSIDKKD